MVWQWQKHNGTIYYVINLCNRGFDQTSENVGGRNATIQNNGCSNELASIMRRLALTIFPLLFQLDGLFYFTRMSLDLI